MTWCADVLEKCSTVYHIRYTYAVIYDSKQFPDEGYEWMHVFLISNLTVLHFMFYKSYQKF